jgi:hypothetical protein
MHLFRLTDSWNPIRGHFQQDLYTLSLVTEVRITSQHLHQTRRCCKWPCSNPCVFLAQMSCSASQLGVATAGGDAVDDGAFTYDRYGHLFPEVDGGAAAKLDAIRTNGVASVCCSWIATASLA